MKSLQEFAKCRSRCSQCRACLGRCHVKSVDTDAREVLKEMTLVAKVAHPVVVVLESQKETQTGPLGVNPCKSKRVVARVSKANGCEDVQQGRSVSDHGCEGRLGQAGDYRLHSNYLQVVHISIRLRGRRGGWNRGVSRGLAAGRSGARARWLNVASCHLRPSRSGGHMC